MLLLLECLPYSSTVKVFVRVGWLTLTRNKLLLSYCYTSSSVLSDTEFSCVFFFKQSMKGKSKSSHDLLKDDPQLSSVPAVKR